MIKSILMYFLTIWVGVACCQMVPPEFKDMVYDQNIMSLRLTHESAEYALPFLHWHSSEQLVLRLDYMSDEPPALFYTLFHCDHDWTLSDLEIHEYLDGYEEELVDYEFSSVSHDNYIHYRLLLPNENTQWLLPGNYLIYVYNKNNKNPCFTKRFVVVDDQMDISGDILQCPQSELSNSHQCLQFEVTNNNFKVANPKEHIKAYAMQNGDWNTLREIPMSRIQLGLPATFIYNDPEIASFEGLAEYFPINARKIYHPHRGVEYIEKDDEGPILYASVRYPYPEMDIANCEYLNGKYMIDKYNDRPPEVAWISKNLKHVLYSETKHDYVRIHFSLEMLEINEPIYVIGSFCQYDRQPWNRMTYDSENGGYSLTLWLKQGYYDYQFMRWDEESQDLKYVGQSSSKTLNDYQIILYHRGATDRWDRPVGYQQLKMY